MSSIGSLQTKTHIVRSSYFDGNPSGRVEYKISPKLMLSNWRLANCGVDTWVDAGALANPHYPDNLGAWAVIENIYLNVNDNEQIDVLRDAKDFLAFLSMKTDNDSCFGEVSPLQKARWGFNLSQDHDQLSNSIVRGASQDFALNSVQEGHLDLRFALAFLRSYPIVYGNKFKNMKLIIEWSSSATGDDIFAKSAGNFGGWTAKRPILLIDEVVGDASKQMAMETMPKQIQWFSVETDQLAIDAVAVGTQSVRQRLRAFDSRVLNRVLMVNKPSNAHYNAGHLVQFESLPMRNEQINLTVNGSYLLQWDGIKYENQKLAKLTDTWGHQTLPILGNLSDFVDNVNRDKMVRNDAGGALDLVNIVRLQSYGGITVGERVDELHVEYQRDFVGATARLTDAFTFKMYGEVGKALNLDQDGFGETVYL